MEAWKEECLRELTVAESTLVGMFWVQAGEAFLACYKRGYEIYFPALDWS